MRLSHVVVIYFMMGAVMTGSGVIDIGQAGIVNEFVDVGDDGAAVNESSVGGAGGSGGEGMLDNLIGPVKNAMNTITGGALLAVWGPVSAFLGYVGWPLVLSRQLNLPVELQILMGVLTVSMVMGAIRVFRSSV